VGLYLLYPGGSSYWPAFRFAGPAAHMTRWSVDPPACQTLKQPTASTVGLEPVVSVRPSLRIIRRGLGSLT